MSALAHHYTPGAGPVVLFLPGYASDMAGTKALAIDGWARAGGRAALRFDYRGCGQSGGDFAAMTLEDWRDDVIAMIDQVAGPVVLVGSSMGGWLMLSAALARPGRVAALVGVAAAPDFTDWGFSADEQRTLLADGRLLRPSPYGPEPTLYTRALWESGARLRLLNAPIALHMPVRLLHGMADADVPYAVALKLVERLAGGDVQLTLIKDGDHRLSRAADIALLIRTIEEVAR
ncbi:alpha/beta hydrolase [Sphingomonas sp.]|uniref:alpha/beta hydrolase family protein n=1 Tax=Sphingomonas sp. TaxID=28214 RepID=UPI001E104000|nr:alpha/beta hydrolase [Sphingomonas sp.]MBX9797233.1 alpha/beta hydrolase [Sphingomonas sp.]